MPIQPEHLLAHVDTVVRALQQGAALPGADLESAVPEVSTRGPAAPAGGYDPSRPACGQIDEPGDCFRSALTVAFVRGELREGRRIAVVQKPLIYVDSNAQYRWVITVPRGYETDFASIPTAVRGLIQPVGPHAEAAVVHDWLYTIGRRSNEPAGRAFADEAMRQAMIRLGVGNPLRWTIYRGVRFGGQRAYGRQDEVRFRDPETLQPDLSVQRDRVDQLRQATVCIRPGLEL